MIDPYVDILAMYFNFISSSSEHDIPRTCAYYIYLISMAYKSVMTFLCVNKIAVCCIIGRNTIYKSYGNNKFEARDKQ